MIRWRDMLRLLKRLDPWLLLAVLALAAAGVAFIYSATFRSPDEPVSSLYRKQSLWAILGLLLFLAITLADYRDLARQSLWLYLGTVTLLILVLAVGSEGYGARRWLGFFGFQVQPSEFAKVAFILALARYLSRPGLALHSFRTTAAALALLALPFLLIARQPDLGTAMVLVPVTLVMLFVAGVPWRWLGLVCGLGVLSLPAAWWALDDYQKQRILVFLDPGRDPLGAGWNKMQSIIAVGSGGLWGKGYLQGTQNVLGYLPRTVAPTDFIYSVIAEETGFVGAALVLGLFLLLVLCCWRAAEQAPDRLGRLLASGGAALVFGHAFVNMAMTIGWLPITGLPLPLISYGGSFMVSTMAVLGLVQSVYVRRSRR